MNTINFNNNAVKAHQFAGGGFETLTPSFNINSTNPWTATIPADGILAITSGKTGTGYSAQILINNVVSSIIFFGDGITLEPQTCIIQLPVKQGDSIKMTTDLLSSSGQTWRIRAELIKYRS